MKLHDSRFNLVLHRKSTSQGKEGIIFFLCQYKAFSHVELQEGPLQMSRESGLASKSAAQMLLLVIQNKGHSQTQWPLVYNF